MNAPTLETARLFLRPWRESDREPFAALNADPEVMRFFLAPLSRAESDAAVDRICAHFENNGFGLWVVEHKETGAFVGITGLAIPPYTLSFSPCVEIGWRLARAHWKKGYATEAASEALRFGFEVLGLDEIVSFTYEGNASSRTVMERIGMKHHPEDDFNHPKVPQGHELSRHVLYRKRKP